MFPVNSSLFESLGQFVQWLSSWVPRIGIMPATHMGVRFRKGNQCLVIEPGLYIWLPITTEIESLPVKRQTLNLPIQTLITQDGVAIAVNVIVIYDISDIMKALVDTWDVEQTISEAALAADVELVTTKTMNWLRENISGEAQKELTRRCRSELHPYGVRVIKSFMSDLCSVTTYRLLGDQKRQPGGLDLEYE